MSPDAFRTSAARPTDCLLRGEDAARPRRWIVPPARWTSFLRRRVRYDGADVEIAGPGRAVGEGRPAMKPHTDELIPEDAEQLVSQAQARRGGGRRQVGDRQGHGHRRLPVRRVPSRRPRSGLCTVTCSPVRRSRRRRGPINSCRAGSEGASPDRRAGRDAAALDLVSSPEHNSAGAIQDLKSWCEAGCEPRWPDDVLTTTGGADEPGHARIGGIPGQYGRNTHPTTAAAV